MPIRGEYPARYYASYDSSVSQPTPVTSWIDAWGLSSVEHLPPADTLIAISADDWNDTEHFRLPLNRGVLDGCIVDYVPPIPLQERARGEQGWIRDQTLSAISVGQNLSGAMQAYARTIAAIASGDDTATLVLPERPTQIFA